MLPSSELVRQSIVITGIRLCACMFVTEKLLNTNCMQLGRNMCYDASGSHKVLETFDLDFWPSEKTAYNLKTNSQKMSDVSYVVLYVEQKWAYSTLDFEGLFFVLNLRSVA